MKLDELNQLSWDRLLDLALIERGLGSVAVVSSFGAEAAVLLHLIAKRAPATPIVLIDTRKLFGETHAYRDVLVRALGLENVRTVSPELPQIMDLDPNEDLWLRDPDSCCAVRKVAPLASALDGVECWISGRKRYQGIDREAVPLAEEVDGRLKLNPLTHWSRPEIAAYAKRFSLPPHPLMADGYRSIGCYTCTDRVAPGEDDRAGRWRGQAKTECGIHLPGAALNRLPTR